MPTTPTPADRPADQLRTAAERARETGDPLHTVLAPLLDRHAKEYDASVAAAANVWPNSADEAARWLAAQVPPEALAVARQLLGTTSEAKRNEIRQSYSELAAQAREDRDHEGAADVELKLRDREEQWRREDAAAVETDEEREPIQLRWGLDDVMYGDDDTTTVLLSGPGGDPYWVELDPERTAALRDALAGPDAAVPPAPADRAAVLREAADYVGNDDTCDCGGCDSCVPNKLAAGLRRLAGEAAAGAHHPTEARTRIADALAAADGWEWAPSFDKTRSPSYQEFLRQADVALAALATPAVPAAPEETR
ncbi:hypothetical protein [Streptomyces halstedii]|uniref:hypothetical protein n=1 Tax=Streptomyces halstedii TaxID=1944 RepID=UPI00345F8761